MLDKTTDEYILRKLQRGERALMSDKEKTERRLLQNRIKAKKFYYKNKVTKVDSIDNK